MGWRVVISVGDGENISSAMETKDEALDLALALQVDGAQVLRLEERAGEVIQWEDAAPAVAGFLGVEGHSRGRGR